ncbi:MAG: hypothetical protein R2813_04230 [Flavobacteriales bacterium]
MRIELNRHIIFRRALVSLLCLWIAVQSSAIAQLPSTLYDSKKDGVITEAFGSGIAKQFIGQNNCALSGDEVIAVKHTVTAQCDLLEIYGDTKIRIEDGGSLIVHGALDLFGSAEITIAPGGVLRVEDNLNASGNSHLVLDGNLTAKGNIVISGSSKICGQGSAIVSGLISGAGWCYDIKITTRQPLELSAELNENQSVKLNWTGQEGAQDKIRIERSENGMSFSEINAVQGATAFVDNPKFGRTYYYRLSRIAAGESVIVSEILAISLIDDAQDGLCTLEVDPNPCVPFCEARLVDCPNGNFKTQILDASGNVVTEIIPYFEADQLIKYHINKENFLLPGVYIVNSQNDKARLSKKVIIK